MKLTEEQRKWLQAYATKKQESRHSRGVRYIVAMYGFTALQAGLVLYIHVLQRPAPDWALNVLSFTSYLLLLVMLSLLLFITVIDVVVCAAAKFVTDLSRRDHRESHVLLMELAALSDAADRTRRWYNKLINKLCVLAVVCLIFTYAAAGWPIRAALTVFYVVGMYAALKLNRKIVDDYITNLTAEEFAARDPNVYAKARVATPVERERQIDMGT